MISKSNTFCIIPYNQVDGKDFFKGVIEHFVIQHSIFSDSINPIHKIAIRVIERGKEVYQHTTVAQIALKTNSYKNI